MQLVLFVGVQASGKSTFFRQRFAETHLRLSLDVLRTRHREAILFNACLEAKQPVHAQAPDDPQHDGQNRHPLGTRTTQQYS
jgi:hypothetical protein